MYFSIDSDERLRRWIINSSWSSKDSDDLLLFDSFIKGLADVYAERGVTPHSFHEVKEKLVMAVKEHLTTRSPDDMVLDSIINSYQERFQVNFKYWHEKYQKEYN